MHGSRPPPPPPQLLSRVARREVPVDEDDLPPPPEDDLDEPPEDDLPDDEPPLDDEPPCDDDFLDDPPDDDLPDDFPDDSPPPSDPEEPPLSDFEDDDLLSLPSLHSDDDRFFDDNFDDIDNFFDDANFGEAIEELSDPEDYAFLSEDDFDFDPEDDFDFFDRPPSPVHTNTTTTTSSSTQAVAGEAGEDVEPLDTHASAPLLQHPDVAKYFKMLKVGLPKDIVATKMKQDGYNTKLLDCDAQQVRPKHLPLKCTSNNNNNRKSPQKAHSGNSEESVGAGAAAEAVDVGPLVSLSEHPMYSKFFKMLKVGLPRSSVEAKLAMEGINKTLLDADPQTQLGMRDLRYHLNNTATNATQATMKAIQSQVSANKQQKKKLFIKSINQRALSANSIWTNDKEDSNDVQMDTDEFNRLFVSSGNNNHQTTVNTQHNAVDSKRQAFLQKLQAKKPLLNLISMKRAQNGAIALSRIKLSPIQIHQHVAHLHPEYFTIEQLKALLEFLPDSTEQHALQQYDGHVHDLGPAEKYMLEMTSFPEAAIFLQVLLFKQQFVSRWHDCKHKFQLIEATCDHIKGSTRLRKVLKIILKIVNELNDDAEDKYAGISIDSLLKLANTKAFDKKTSVLQYVISLIARHDADMLLFPEDLKHLTEVSKLCIDALNTERTALESELLQHLQTMRTIQKKMGFTATRMASVRMNSSSSTSSGAASPATPRADSAVVAAPVSPVPLTPAPIPAVPADVGVAIPPAPTAPAPPAGRPGPPPPPPPPRPATLPNPVEGGKPPQPPPPPRPNAAATSATLAESAPVVPVIPVVAEVEEDQAARIQTTIHDLEGKLKPLCHELAHRYLKLSTKFTAVLEYFGEDTKLKCEGFFVPLHKFVQDFVSIRIQVEKIRQVEHRKPQQLARQQQVAAAKLSAKK